MSLYYIYISRHNPQSIDRTKNCQIGRMSNIYVRRSQWLAIYSAGFFLSSESAIFLRIDIGNLVQKVVVTTYDVNMCLCDLLKLHGNETHLSSAISDQYRYARANACDGGISKKIAAAAAQVESPHIHTKSHHY